MEQTFWRRCSSCKAELPFERPHWVCSVSTCNRKRTGLTFCSVSCWEVHLPGMRHREAYAVEARAPSRAEWERERAEEDAAAAPSSRAAPSPRPRVVPRAETAETAPMRRVVLDSAADGELSDDDLPYDVLIVVSKLKKYIRARSGMNTSDNVVDILSDHVRRLCDEAIRNAGRDGRKTVFDRDFRRPG
jgi:hypothetical protein